MKKMNIILCASLIFAQSSFASYQINRSSCIALAIGSCMALYYCVKKEAYDRGYQAGYSHTPDTEQLKPCQDKFFDDYAKELSKYGYLPSDKIAYQIYYTASGMIEFLATEDAIYAYKRKERLAAEKQHNEEQNRQKRNNKSSKSKQHLKHFTNKHSKCFSRKHFK